MMYQEFINRLPEGAKTPHCWRIRGDRARIRFSPVHKRKRTRGTGADRASLQRIRYAYHSGHDAHRRKAGQLRTELIAARNKVDRLTEELKESMK